VVDSQGDSRHTEITLSPLNPDFKPITLTSQSEGDVQVVAEWIAALGRM
jgi:SOS-response transcriptional repressor LexA